MSYGVSVSKIEELESLLDILALRPCRAGKKIE
jgi:hypothetical protein